MVQPAPRMSTAPTPNSDSMCQSGRQPGAAASPMLQVHGRYSSHVPAGRQNPRPGSAGNGSSGRSGARSLPAALTGGLVQPHEPQVGLQRGRRGAHQLGRREAARRWGCGRAAEQQRRGGGGAEAGGAPEPGGAPEAAGAAEPSGATAQPRQQRRRHLGGGYAAVRMRGALRRPVPGAGAGGDGDGGVYGDVLVPET